MAPKFSSTGSDSLRIDLSNDSLLAENRRQPGADYLDGDDPNFSDRRPVDKLLNEILKKVLGIGGRRTRPSDSDGVEEGSQTSPIQ